MKETTKKDTLGGDKKLFFHVAVSGKSRIFAASIVERFDLIATTRKNAKTMLFPWVPEPAEGPFQLQTSHTNLLLNN